MRRIQNANLFNNTLMSYVMGEKEVCQYVLRILTGDETIRLRTVHSQHHVSQLYSKDAVLDVFAEDTEGRLYLIEVQNPGTMDHPRRIRLYVSEVDSEYLRKGETYHGLPNLWLFYLTPTDLFHIRRSVMHVDEESPFIREAFRTGQKITLVNAAYDEGTEISRLMQYFKETPAGNTSHGPLSDFVNKIKGKGGEKMLTDYYDDAYEFGFGEGKAEGRAEGRAEGKAEGIDQNREENIRSLMDTLELTVQQAMNALRIPASDQSKYLPML